jgi:hypothetical protein
LTINSGSAHYTVTFVLSFPWKGFRFSHGGKQTKKKNNNNNKRKKIRRMSKDLNAKNNLADTSRGFEKDWPLSNNDAKLTKKQFDQKALDNFFENWMKTWPNRAHF